MVDNGGPVINTLRLLEILYENKWLSLADLARKTCLTQSVTRRTLEQFESQGWIETQIVANAYLYHITPKALLRPATASIYFIKELLEENQNVEKR